MGNFITHTQSILLSSTLYLVCIPIYYLRAVHLVRSDEPLSLSTIYLVYSPIVYLKPLIDALVDAVRPPP